MSIDALVLAADQALSGTSFVAVGGLSIPLDIGVYGIDMCISFVSAATADVKWRLDFDGTMTGRVFPPGNGVIQSSYNAINSAGQTLATDGDYETIQRMGFINVTAAGTLQLEAAQNTASGASSVKAGSWMRIYTDET